MSENVPILVRNTKILFFLVLPSLLVKYEKELCSEKGAGYGTR
jgi:hypothetical protein